MQGGLAGLQESSQQLLSAQCFPSLCIIAGVIFPKPMGVNGLTWGLGPGQVWLCGTHTGDTE